MRRTLNDENDTGDYYKVGMKNIKEKAFIRAPYQLMRESSKFAIFCSRTRDLSPWREAHTRKMKLPG